MGAAEFSMQYINFLYSIVQNQKKLGRQFYMRYRNIQKAIKIQSNYETQQKPSLPTLPIIPTKSEQLIIQSLNKNMISEIKIYDSTNQEKIIPGYNFQSLFRKKSHIRLARKKNKQQALKKNSCIKLENNQKQTKNTLKGHWTHEENKLYHWFLQIHNRHFILKYLRRADKIFKSMAHFIKTRQAEQCRSHHQKMQKKYHNFYQILTKLRMQFYNSTNPQLLKAQLQQNGYKIKQYAIITQQQLKNGDLIKYENNHQQIKSQNSNKNSEYDQGDSSQQQNSLFGQNYQKGLDFKLKYQ